MTTRNRSGGRIETFRDLLQRSPVEEGERTLYLALSELFETLASREEVRAAYPDFIPHLERFRAAIDRGDVEAAEDEISGCYCRLHGADSAYSPAERSRLDALGGYWCHAGGLSPLWRAAPYIGPGTRLADYGAGNGFQALLFQHLYPHLRTVMIELSGPMIEKGKELQRMMGIPEGKVEWIHGSVTDVPPREFDFIYIYRPLRPEGDEGRRFYERFAAELEGVERVVTIFSIADCLKDFLGAEFRVFHDDGHLTCFTGGPSPADP